MSIKLNSAAGGSVSLVEPSTGTDYSVVYPAASGNAVITPLPAGTTSNAPLVLTTGSLLTTPVAGAMEYDGETLLFTPIGTQRGVVPGMQYFRLNSDLVGSNATGAQNMLGVGVTLSSSTIYAFEAAAVFVKTAGITSHTLSTLFGGTATINNIYYTVHAADQNVSINTRVSTAQGITPINVTSATIVTGAMASATQIAVLNIKGTVSINSGGTFIPQYSLSAAPGGAYTVVAGGYFAIYPIAVSGSNTSIGAWV